MDYIEIRVGVKVDFLESNTGIEIKDCTVTREPWYMDGNWVCMIDMWNRCVKCADLTPAKRKDRTNWTDRTYGNANGS